MEKGNAQSVIGSKFVATNSLFSIWRYGSGTKDIVDPIPGISVSRQTDTYSTGKCNWSTWGEGCFVYSCRLNVISCVQCGQDLVEFWRCSNCTNDASISIYSQTHTCHSCDENGRELGCDHGKIESHEYCLHGKSGIHD